MKKCWIKHKENNSKILSKTWNNYGKIMKKSWKNHLNITWKENLNLKLNIKRLFDLMKLVQIKKIETSNLAKSEYLPLCTIVYCGLDCKVSIAQSIFCLTSERTSLYNDWSLKMPGFFLVDFISTHSG